jgi:hypothetical protein
MPEKRLKTGREFSPRLLDSVRLSFSILKHTYDVTSMVKTFGFDSTLLWSSKETCMESLILMGPLDQKLTRQGPVAEYPSPTTMISNEVIVVIIDDQ